MKKSLSFKFFIFAGTIVFMSLTFFTASHGAGPTVEKPLTLKYAMLVSPKHLLVNLKTGPIEWWAREVEKRTGNRIKVKIYYSQALGKAKDHFDLARTGVADVAGFVQGYTRGYFPLTSVAELPYPAPGMSYSVVSKAMWKLYKMGVLDKMYNKVKVLSMDPTDRYQLFLKKKISKAEDLKGLKIRTFGYWKEILKAWGANPVPMTIADAYLGLQRGIIKGLPHNWASAPSWKTYEVIDNVVETKVACAALGSAMNLKTWNSLPADIQRIIDEISEEQVGFTTRGSEKYGLLGYELYGEKIARPLYIKKGINVYTLAPEEMDKLRKAVLPLWDKWVKDMEAKGLPGKKVIETYISVLKELGAKPVYSPTWK